MLTTVWVEDMQVFFARILFLQLFCNFEIISKFSLYVKKNSLAS